MARYAAMRLVVLIPTLLVSSFLVFCIVAKAAGDPRDELALCLECDESTYADVVERYDLDQPLLVRYGRWFERAITGDFGSSSSQGEGPVLSVVGSRLVNSLWLVGPAWVISMVASVFLSIASVHRPKGWLSRAYQTIGLWAWVIPVFVVGLFLQAFVVWVAQRWGVKPFRVQGLQTGSVVAYLSSAALPTLTLVGPLVAFVYPVLRSALENVASSPYIAAARARGIGERRILWRHILTGANGQLVLLIGRTSGLLVGETIVVETIFGWPGMGDLTAVAIRNHDIETSLFVGVAAVGFVLTVGMIMDLIHAKMDPRVREGRW